MNNELELLEELYTLERQKLCELAKDDILSFTLYTKEDYLVNWHHKYLCEKLNDFANGKIKRMMVFMPPQHGKSELTSRRLPAYMLGRNPNLRIALCAYNATFASKFNRQVQRIMSEKSYTDVFPDTTLNSKNVATDSKGAYLRNSEQFEIVDKNGSFISVGVGGGITGNPVDIALIDDPIKGAEEAGSQTYREKLWEWYTTELETRLNNNSQILVTLTRWNIEDLAGRILSHKDDEFASEWEVVVFPRIKVDNSNPNDPREVGEVLWEDVHSMQSAMEARQRNMVKFEALQQQNPKIMESGNEFYKGFNEGVQVKSCEYNPSIALHISLDENVNPYITGTIYQVVDKTIYQIDELCLAHPKNTLREIALEFSLRYSGHVSGLFVYGDATSKKEDTKLEKGQNFFTLFCKYVSEFNPVTRLPNANPSIAMRGNFINEVFENNQGGIHFYVDPGCHHSIADFRFTKEAPDGTKFKKKEKDMRTGVSYEKYGHCFVAGTKVLTETGYIDIDKIKKGDKVLTRKGYKKVKWSGITNHDAIVKTYRIGENEITCTPDHKIFTFNKGFMSADSLIHSNTFCIFDEKLKTWKKKLLNTTVIDSVDIHNQKRQRTESIIEDMLKSMVYGLKSTYIDICGSVKKGLYLKSIISIIRMVILAIILLITWSVYSVVNIYRIITNIYRKNKKITKKEYLKKKPVLEQVNGMDQKKARNGIKSMLMKALNVLLEKLSAGNAEQPTQQNGKLKHYIAPQNAESGITCEDTGKKIVYDITVEGQHEFFANNILVHNCSDSFDYLITKAFEYEFKKFQRRDSEVRPIVGYRNKKR